MSVFVEDCRREWERLGVPDPVANEMAADLEADLAEAAADGLSAEQVLGSGAFDARSFAASWATERGVVAPQPPRPPLSPIPTGAGNRLARGPRRSASPALAAIAIIATLGAGLALLSVRFGSASMAVPASFGVPPAPDAPGRAFAFPVGPSSSHDLLHALGVVILVVGLVGLVLAVVYRSSWVSLGRWAARPSTSDAGSGNEPGH